MSEEKFSVGKARRAVAGNFWCAQSKNQGKFPCLNCRGKGTTGLFIGEGCEQCKNTGIGNSAHFKLWLKLFIYETVTGKRHNEILHGRPTLWAPGNNQDDGED